MNLEYRIICSTQNVKTFLLLPSVESLLKRFDDRGDNKELHQRTIELYDRFSEKKDKLNWQIIDSSNHTLEETVDQIYKVIAQS